MRNILFLVLSLLVSGLTLSAQQPISNALQSLVDAEQDFARLATTRGIRDSFLEFFTEDSIALVPGPQSAVERLKGQPARPFSEQSLEWEPRAGDIAASLDFGWLTGPSIFTDRVSGGAANGAPRYGNYLSIWRRTSAWRWKVYIDVGSDAPSPVTFAPGFVQMALPSRYTFGAEPSDANSIVEVDKALNAGVASAGVSEAMATVLAAESRVHRKGALPHVGRANILEFFQGLDPASQRPACTTGGSGAARSSDLGYSYGLCTAPGASAPTSYLRVWARDASARWWLVIDAG